MFPSALEENLVQVCRLSGPGLQIIWRNRVMIYGRKSSFKIASSLYVLELMTAIFPEWYNRLMIWISCPPLPDGLLALETTTMLMKGCVARSAPHDGFLVSLRSLLKPPSQARTLIFRHEGKDAFTATEENEKYFSRPFFFCCCCWNLKIKWVWIYRTFLISYQRQKNKSSACAHVEYAT